jgi:cis-3-alkyl-4-acyloxetan-2-one decarboxylase
VTSTIAAADANTSGALRAHAPERTLDPKTAPWGAEYPFASHYLEVQPGIRMHYLDEGPKDAPVLVCLHGNPTWSFYWRKLAASLRDSMRVIVPDHVGCGMSDRPQDWSYRLADHIDNVQKLLAHLGIKKFSLAVHDWGGAIGMGVATERPDDVEKLIVTNTAAFRSTDIPPSIASVRIPVFGRIAVLQFNAFAGAATFRAVERPLSRTAKAGLLAPYGTPHDRIATLRFVEDIPMKESHPSWARLGRIEERLALLKDKPMMLLWGDKDFCFSPKFRARWQQLFPSAAVHAWDDVSHYVMEDAPDRVLPLARAFLGVK